MNAKPCASCKALAEVIGGACPADLLQRAQGLGIEQTRALAAAFVLGALPSLCEPREIIAGLLLELESIKKHAKLTKTGSCQTSCKVDTNER